MATGPHLVGAYGLHWKRSEVSWTPGRGRPWQMLGRRGSIRPGLRVCDFRKAAGLYVLERNSVPVYVGLARSSEGIGFRLRSHHKEGTKSWTGFSWFSFDDVKDMGSSREGWCYVDQREWVSRSPMRDTVAELEALLVSALRGRALMNVQDPRFRNADQWTQIVRSNYGPGGICHRVDTEGFWDQRPFG